MKLLLSFLVLGAPRPADYITRRRLLRGGLAYLGLTLALGWAHLPAALVVLVVPPVLSWAVVMLGNWAPHAFIAPARPASDYPNSETRLNTRDSLLARHSVELPDPLLRTEAGVLALLRSRPPRPVLRTAGPAVAKALHSSAGFRAAGAFVATYSLAN